ncbi:hypothetical protein [Dyella sp. GSA-30]|uniref:hypothetical protein n=1 Tax=Dyella sp. GSA-30 TaxID=2994496 RepID=UPI00248FCBEF|nr:hypothetical protein [Dyella sp. GSA-30]BDU20345.1 hypothetical protein DYGSA30_18020 [Dyella sp. GSA-30]
MSISTLSHDPHRARLLRALGVTPWVRRQPFADPIPAVFDTNEAVAALQGTPGDSIVVLPAGCPVALLDLLGRAFSAYGPSLARAARIEVGVDGQLGHVPEARAYLVFGQAQAHALGRVLPAAVLNRAQIVLADEPHEIRANGAGKRRLWNALRSLRRALASGGAA